MKKERRVINIDKNSFDVIKKYCDDNSLKTHEWIAKKIIEFINKEKNEK
jgi:hypothetical protein